MVLMFGEINIVFIFAALNYGSAALELVIPNRSLLRKGNIRKYLMEVIK